VFFWPYIDMNPPWVYICSPSWTPLPPPSPSHPSGSSQCTSPEHPASCIEPGLAIYFTYDNIHAAKSLQSCPTLCDPIDSSPPGSPVPGTLQARTLEWVAISFSNAWKWKVKVKSLSRVRPSATPWTAAFQAPLSMGFSSQEYWSGVPTCFNAILSNHHTLTFSHRVQQSVLYICVSFAVLAYRVIITIFLNSIYMH